MNGHLHLVCALNAVGESHLRSQSFRAPLHLSKPHLDEGTLVVNMVNPTAGIFDDDRIELQVVVETGARLVLTTPSASRVYRSRRGGASQVSQKLEVQSGAFLEYFPEPFIPQAGARCVQRNELRVAPGGTLLYFEWLTPGRVASGEVFQYTELCWDTDFWLGGRLNARERYRLRPGDESLAGLKLAFPAAHYVSCLAVGCSESPQEIIAALDDETVYAGCAPLVAGGWSIKLLCRDALAARQALRHLREGLHRHGGTVPARLGRF